MSSNERRIQQQNFVRSESGFYDGVDTTTHRGSVYSNDPDYDSYRGRVTHHSEIVGITLDGWKVRHTVTVIDLGKPAALPCKTGDELLEPEKMPGDLRSEMTRARAGRIAAGRARRQGKRDAIASLLREQGPLTCAEIAEALGYVVQTTRKILEAARYEQFDKVGGVPGAHGGVPVAIWGLAGVHKVQR